MRIEATASILEEQPSWRVEKMMYLRFWKSWLELRPAVWRDYQTSVTRLRGYQAKRLKEVEEGRNGVEIMDYFTDELRDISKACAPIRPDRSPCDPAWLPADLTPAVGEPRTHSIIQPDVPQPRPRRGRQP